MKEHTELRRVDDFRIRVGIPLHGKLTLKLRLGENPNVRLTLSAADDELMKLRAWMEDIARGVSPALVHFADGSILSCRREQDDESGFAETERFLDEAYPSSISVFCMRDARGNEYSAVLKTKHYLNALYLQLLTGGNPDRQSDYLPHFRTQWYAHTPQGMPRKQQHLHYRLFSSRLLEWYMCCGEAIPRSFPRFKPLPEDTVFLLMWSDYGGALFWNDENECCGASDHIWLCEEKISLSDIPELATWESDFHVLADMVHDADTEDTEEYPIHAIDEKERTAWHIRGLHLAHQLRPRLPLSLVLLYEQSWDLAFGTPYFNNDCGRIIFDERFIEEDDK